MAMTKIAQQSHQITALKQALDSALLQASARASAPAPAPADTAALEAAKNRNKMAMAKIAEQTREISALRQAQGAGGRAAPAPPAATVVFDRSSNQGLGIQFVPTPTGRGVQIKGIDPGSQVRAASPPSRCRVP